MNATEYLKLWKEHKTWNRLTAAVHQQRFRKIASFLKGSIFIDVGCALGHSTHYLSIHRNGLWAGMDFDESAICEARMLFPQHDFYYSPDYNMIETTGGRKFDSVVCSEVIEHVEKDRLFVEELLKLAKERIVLTTPAKPIVSKGHLRCYTRETLALLFKGMNYRVRKEGRFFYITIEINETIN